MHSSQSIELFSDLIETTTQKNSQIIINIDPSSTFSGGTSLGSLGSDELLTIFSFLPIGDINSLGTVCKEWRVLHKHNRLWQTIILDKFGSVDNFVSTLQSKLIRAPEIETMPIAPMNVKRTPKKKKSSLRYASTKLELITNWKNSPYSFYKAYTTLYGSIAHKKEKLKHREEKKRKFKLLEKPQKFFDWIYLALCPPLILICLLCTTICFPLYLDGIIPRTYGSLFGVLTPFLIALIPLFLFTGVTSFVANYIRSLRLETKIETMLLLFFVGNIWIPLVPFLFGLKLLILPDIISWRATMSPSWVVSFVFSFATFFLPPKFKMKFGIAQKLLWVFNTGLNMCVCLVTGLISAKLDGGLSDNLGYLNFIFVPIWLLAFAILCTVGIGGFYLLHRSGWKITFLLYWPLVLNFFLPLLPFFIILGFKLDGLLDVANVLVFIPLMYWNTFWLLASLVYSLIITFE